MKICFLNLFLIFCLSVSALKAFGTELDSLAVRSQRAAAVLDEVVRIPDDAIPESLLNKAECVATIPNVVRIAFIFGGRVGQGLVSCRTPTGWSAPSFIKIAGASWGFQIGIEAIDIVMVFTRANALEKFSNTNLTLGADATVAAGPIGRDAQVGTDFALNSEVYSYSRSRGLFFGVSLQGTVISVDKDANSLAYGTTMSAKDVLKSTGNGAPAVGMEYVRSLTAHTVPH